MAVVKNVKEIMFSQGQQTAAGACRDHSSAETLFRSQTVKQKITMSGYRADRDVYRYRKVGVFSIVRR